MKPIFRVVCPCCACSIFDVRARVGPITWTCSYCGFSMMGLAVPIQWQKGMLIVPEHVMKTLEQIKELGCDDN